ncbi:MAG: hypothetical protein JXB35_07600 [Anaerolineae bacterium]|nr:hypothetical protein [Anaerolineae bacterium]
MSGWDEDVQQFLAYWFSGFAEGLAALDVASQDCMLRACGRACAASYTSEVFETAWRESGSLGRFLERLAIAFPAVHYEQLAPRTIRVCIERCGCDLVNLGLVTSPLLCACSMHNLRENFAHALGIPVEVVMETTILQGGAQCEFLVRGAFPHEGS